MTLRVILSLAVLSLGVVLGIYELVQRHWLSGLGFFCSAVLTGGLIFIGKEFLTESFLGAGLAVATALLGFYGFLFENRALDLSLDKARFEAAIALSQENSGCSIPESQEKFRRAAQACIVQSNLDKIAAVGDGVREAYVPTNLDLADKTLSTATGERPDLCEQQFSHLYGVCPDSFSSMSRSAKEKLGVRD